MRTVGVAAVAVVMTMVCGAGEESGRKKFKNGWDRWGEEEEKKGKKKKKDGGKKEKKKQKKNKDEPSLARAVPCPAVPASFARNDSQGLTA